MALPISASHRLAADSSCNLDHSKDKEPYICMKMCFIQLLPLLPQITRFFSPPSRLVISRMTFCIDFGTTSSKADLMSEIRVTAILGGAKQLS